MLGHSHTQCVIYVQQHFQIQYYTVLYTYSYSKTRTFYEKKKFMILCKMRKSEDGLLLSLFKFPDVKKFAVLGDDR